MFFPKPASKCFDRRTILKYWRSTPPYSSFQIQTGEAAIQWFGSAVPSRDVTGRANEPLRGTNMIFQRGETAPQTAPCSPGHFDPYLMPQHWGVIIFSLSYFNDFLLNEQILSLGKGNLDWFVRTGEKWEVWLRLERGIMYYLVLFCRRKCLKKWLVCFS